MLACATSHGCVSFWKHPGPKPLCDPRDGVGGLSFPPSSIPESLVLICPQQERKPKPRALKSLTFSPCSCREWPNPCYCFLLHLNFHLATFPFFLQFLKYFSTFLPGKSRDLTMPFLFSLGKGHFSTTYFCSVYTELSKEKKNVEFIPAEEGADLHFPALAWAAFSPLCWLGCSALSGALNLGGLGTIQICLWIYY